jgi:membrane associated rhomboid family serine protease
MHADSDSRTVLMTAADRAACAELALVLEAQAIPVSLEPMGSSWVLSVPATYAEQSRRELATYLRENTGRRGTRPPPQRLGRGWPGVVAYIVIIMLVAVLVRQLGFGIDWVAVGRMDAGRTLHGEWWRAVTALTLHADAGHLLGNAAFGSFFAYSIGRYWGGGFGWLAIVLTGVIGNILNALVSGPAHLSIGASTAVFGALGLLSAYGWRRGFPPEASLRERAAPVVAGLGLLAYTGTAGVNTDIGAHLMGFGTGFALALVIARYGLPTSRRVQLAAGALAWGLVLGGWCWAILASS